jgi:hypothetical protein
MSEKFKALLDIKRVVGVSYLPETIKADASSIEVGNAWILSWFVAGSPCNRLFGNPDIVFESRPSITHILLHCLRWVWHVPRA